MESKDLSVLIPAYREEENLRMILPRIHKVLSEMNVAYEIFVIDTMQHMDNTEQACKENGALYINREHGNNYGDAVRTGIKHAGGKWTLFMDADGSHSPEFIQDLYRYRNDHDIVIASRYVKGGGSDNSLPLKAMSLIVNVVFSWFLDLGCRDVSNSFKLYRTSLLKEVHLSSNNFEVIEEILVKMKRKNKQLKIMETPFYFKERMFGHTKRNLAAFIFSYLVVLIKLKYFTED